jgi:hypothetical protein
MQAYNIHESEYLDQHSGVQDTKWGMTEARGIVIRYSESRFGLLLRGKLARDWVTFTNEILVNGQWSLLIRVNAETSLPEEPVEVSAIKGANSRVREEHQS